MSDSSGDRNPVEELAEEYLERKRRGEQPSLEEYVTRYPQWADEIRELFPAILMMEDFKPGSDDLTSGPGEAAPIAARAVPSRIGDYRILREIGRGGMGVVYEAEQVSLGRRVALKLLPSHVARDPLVLERFRREARAAARLHHTNVVPVFEVGQEGDTCYYAMQFIQGQPLDQVMIELARLRSGKRAAGGPSAAETQQIAQSVWRDEFEPQVAHQRPSSSQEADAVATRQETTEIGGRDKADVSATGREAATVRAGRDDTSTVNLPGQSDLSLVESQRRHFFRSIARVGLQVADALSYAHARGVVHRDIKPSNLLLDASGVVWVTDFGLAKTEEEGLTQTGDIVGTVRYMAPERFRGDCDVRSDVYSLGVTLYELATLRSAFDSSDRIELIDMIARREPTAPRSLDSRIPRDLETIILKAIDKDPNRRYPSAQALGEDLRQFVDDQPIKARRMSSTERFTRWVRHHKALAASLLAIALSLVALSVGSSIAAVRFRELAAAKENAFRAADGARMEAEAQRDEAKRLREQTRRSLYLAHVQMAQQAASDPGQVGRLQRLLGQWRPEPDVPDLRDWEWYFLNAQRHQEQATLHGHTYGVGAVAWSPDGRRFASASVGGIVKIWNAKTREEAQTLYGHSTDVCPLAWSPDGQKLASAGADSSVMVWDAVAGDELPLISGQGKQLLSVAWSPDGTRLASAWRDEGIRICDAATGRELTALPPHSGRVDSMAWHPNGKWLASAGENAPIQIWDVQTGEEVIELPGHAHIVFCLQWSPEGKRLASGSCSCDKTTMKVWEPPATEPVLTFTGHAGGVRSVSWSPDGRHVASASSDRTARIWNAATGEEIQALRGHSDEVESVCWSPDGGCLLTGSRDRTIKFWDATPQTGATTLEGHADLVGTVAWSPDGGRLASASDDETVRIWDRETREVIVTLSGHTGKVQSVCWSPGGDRLASVGSDNTLRIWSAQTGEQLQASAAHPEGEKGTLCVSWSPDGTRLATSASDRLITIWDADSGKELRTLRGHGGSVRSVSFSPDGTRLASAGAGGTVRLWDVASGVETATLRGPRELIHCVVFSPDGSRLISAGGLGSRTITKSGSERGTIRLWDLSTHQPLLVLHGHTDFVRAVCWSPEGRRLASASTDGKVKVWEITSTGGADTGWELLTLDAHPDGACSVCWSPDRMSIASAGAEGNVKIWDAEPGYALERAPELLSKLDRKVTGGAATAADLKLRAEILAQEGRWDEAAADFDRAAEMFGEAAPGWFMTPFWVTGPYPEDLGAEYAPQRSTDPHTPIPGVEWSTSGTPSTRHWHLAAVAQNEPINFANYFERADHVSGYAMTRVYATHGQPTGILLGSDDTVRLWLGGQLVHEHDAPRTARPDEDAVRVSLKAGWNTVLAKVVNVTGEHGLFLRLSDHPVELAQGYWSSGLRKEALEQLDRAVAADPEMAALRFMRGSREMEMGLFDRGEADFAKAVELLPGKALPYVTRANAYWELRHYDKAFADLNKAVEMMPDAPRLHMLRGGWHVRRGHWQEGEADLTKAMELAPTDHPIAYRLAALRPYMGDEKEYAHLRQRMLAEWGDTNSPVVAERTAKACLLLPPSDDELGQLVELADRAVAAGPDHGLYKFFLLAKGMAEYRAERFSGAVEALKESLALTPSRSLKTLDHLLLAMSYHRIGQAEEAREAFDQAHQIITNEFPEMEEDDLGGGWNDVLMCLVVYREAEKLHYGPVQYHTKNARELIADGNLPGAAKELTTALEHAPEDVELLRTRAHAYARHGEWELAAEDFTRVIQLDPDEHWNWHLLGPLLVESGQLDRYRDHCHQMLERFDASSGWMPFGRAIQACLWLPDTVEDWHALAEAAEENAADADASKLYKGRQAAKGMVDYRSGDYASARTWLQRSGMPSGALETRRLLFAAMTYYRLGEHVQAGQALHKAYRSVESQFARLERGDIGTAWQDWLICRILIREAEELLYGPVLSNVRSAEKLASEGKLAQAAEELTRAVKRLPGDIHLLRTRGDLYARLGRWEEARADLTEAVKVFPEDFDDWRALAVLYLQVGDTEGFKSICKDAFQRFFQKGASTQARLVQVCTLAPDAGVDPENLAHVAQRALSQADGNTTKLAKGMADYRCDRLDEATTQLPQTGDFIQAAISQLFRAMAHHRQGRTQLAQDLLKLGHQTVQANILTIEGPPLADHMPQRWVVWCMLRIVRDEASRVILGVPWEESGIADETLSESQLVRLIEELNRLIENKPEDAGLLLGRARFYVRLRRWKEAADDCVTAVELQPADTMAWLHAGPLLLTAGDLEGYSEHCRRMLQHFEETDDPIAADRTIKVCLLLPGTVDVSRLPLRTLENALDGRSAPSWFYGWGFCTRAMAAYRAGDADKAVQWIGKSQEAETYADTPALQAEALTVAAMAHHQLGHAEESQQSYADAVALIDAHLPKLQSGEPVKGGLDWLIAEILRREAEDLFARPAPAAAPEAGRSTALE